MDEVIADDDSDDLLAIRNNRVTRMEYQKASAERKQIEDGKGDMSFNEERKG